MVKGKSIEIDFFTQESGSRHIPFQIWVTNKKKIYRKCTNAKKRLESQKKASETTQEWGG